MGKYNVWIHEALTIKPQQNKAQHNYVHILRITYAKYINQSGLTKLCAATEGHKTVWLGS